VANELFVECAGRQHVHGQFVLAVAALERQQTDVQLLEEGPEPVGQLATALVEREPAHKFEWVWKVELLEKSVGLPKQD